MFSSIWPRQSLFYRRVLSRQPVQCTRKFHPSTPSSAKRRPRGMADSTWRRQRAIQRGPQYNPRVLAAQGVSVESQIPVKLLQEATKAGVLKSSTLAIQMLRQCVDLYYNDRDTPREIVLEGFKDISDSETFAVTGYLARRYRETKEVGEWMLTLAADSGNSFAITVLAVDHLKLVKPGKTDLLNKLESIAEKGENPQAMVAHGIVLARMGKRNEALELYEKAMEISKPIPQNPFVDFMLNNSIPHPWAAYGELKNMMGDSKTARKALEHGAIVYESVPAVLLLAANAGISKNWDKYVEYLTKCAMDGEPKASFYLGAFYLKKFYEDSKNQTSRSVFTRLFSLRPTDHGTRSLALEWFRIAAEYGHSRSALLAAGLLREDHKFKEGALYLDIAEESSETFKSAQSMRNCFLDRDAMINLEQELPTKTFDAGTR